MNFPRYLVLVIEVAAFPNPPANAILCAKGFVNQGLLVQGFLKVFISYAALYFSLYQLEGLIHVTHVDLLVQE